MGANSGLRRALKRLLAPVSGGRQYRFLQSLAMAWDIRVGNYPEPEVKLIPLAVREGETAIDIGANYGFYTYHLSHAVGHTGRVYAFEPVPFTKDSLELIAKLLRFRNVRIIPKGCSDRAGRISFTIPLQSSGAISAGLAHISARDTSATEGGKGEGAQEEETSQEVWCDVVALDEFLVDVSDLSFIKCDIEGAELLAFRGAKGLITRHHPTVLCEVNHRFLEGFGLTPADLAGFFFEKGYKLYAYDGGPEGLRELAALSAEAEGNFLFIHPGRLERFAPVMNLG